MSLRRKKIVIVSLVVSIVILVLVAVCAFFVIREYFWKEDPEDLEICIKTRCMPSELFRRSSSSYVCSPDNCVITSSNISDVIDTTCIDIECITRADKDKYSTVNSSTVCLDTLCFKASAVEHLKAGGNCSTTDCIVAAGEVLKVMDPSIKPCDDFYEHACHRASKNVISDRQKIYSVEKALNETLNAPIQPTDSDSLITTKRVYRMCVQENSAGIKDYAYLSDLLKSKELGDWPLLEQKYPSRNCRAELEIRTAMLHVYGVETFFRLEVDYSEEDSTPFIKMTVAPPLFEGTCSPENDDARRKNRKYVEMLNKMFTHLLKDGGRAKRTVDRIKAFDHDFCLATKVKNSSTEDGPSRITLEELADIAPQFNWKLWHSMIASEFDIDARLKNAPIYVYDVQHYIHGILYLTEDATPAWINYLSLKFLLSYVGFLDRPLREIIMEYSPAFKDYTTYAMQPVSLMPRWKQCQKYLQKVMGIALIPSFVSEMITEGVGREMEYLAELVKRSFKETFHHSRVLYEQEKKQVMKTITKFGVLLLYPTENETFYDEYYSNMGPLGQSFLETGMQVRWFHQKKIFQAVYRGGRDYDLELEVLVQNPFESHAFAAVGENKTVIFIGGMHVAGVKPNVPRYMNFATLGTTIALEYVIGSHLLSVKPGKDTFDLKSKEWAAWPEYIRQHVKEKRQCYVDRYSAETQENEDQVVQEMMADVQALKESLQAYRIYSERYGHEPLLPIPNLTEKDGDEQLFFILYAQSFCNVASSEQSKDGRFPLTTAERVNEVLRNLGDFSDAFHCQSGSPMSPSDKCGTVW